MLHSSHWMGMRTLNEIRTKIGTLGKNAASLNDACGRVSSWSTGETNRVPSVSFEGPGLNGPMGWDAVIFIL